jgi:hypothetical protein
MPRVVNSRTDDDDCNRLTPTDGWITPSRIANCIRAGNMPSDRAFDQLLPPEFQGPSEHYWTPLRLALRAGDWFEEFGVQSVVDIGSGVGKFCVIAALRCRARFVGIEHRKNLVEAARDLASTFGVADRVEFRHEVFGRSRTPAAGAYYLFHPFGENLYELAKRLDDSVETSRPRFVHEVWRCSAYCAWPRWALGW